MVITMRAFMFWVVFFVGVSAVLSKASSVSDTSVSDPEVVTALDPVDVAIDTVTKPKDQSNDIFSTVVTNRDLSSISEEDYPIIDPSPSSKASIRSGPIEHGTPLMPYVPRAMPPAVAPTPPRHVSPP